MHCYSVSARAARHHWQYPVTGLGNTFDLQLLSQCSSTKNCERRSIPRYIFNVAGTLSNHETNVSIDLSYCTD